MGLEHIIKRLASIEKMKIIAYKDVNFEHPTGEVFPVMFNPNTFSQNFSTVWDSRSPQGGTAETQSYRRRNSDNVTFEFLFDGTGVSGTAGKSSGPDSDKNNGSYVQQQIDAFLKITQKLNGETHQPNFLELSWGTFIFHCVLTSATVTYKLFHSSGTPLRATIKATFSQNMSMTEQAARARLSSPDLTHVRIVKTGETLPQIAKEVYGSSFFYLEIARVNKLNNFRKLKPGQKLVLPPVNKKENG